MNYLAELQHGNKTFAISHNGFHLLSASGNVEKSFSFQDVAISSVTDLNHYQIHLIHDKEVYTSSNDEFQKFLEVFNTQTKKN
ncbi:hypothetical protein NST38_31430 [Paenibacillus sp. FSL H8-0104]|uniref:hypothetical protein n=1 Tax=Paenibacillus sp. FSL H8-0104 TaxID=2954509 RepID=UPI0030FD54C2